MRATKYFIFRCGRRYFLGAWSYDDLRESVAQPDGDVGACPDDEGLIPDLVDLPDHPRSLCLTAIHLNIPEQNPPTPRRKWDPRSWVKRHTWRRLGWLVLGLFAPEMVR